MVGTEMVSPPAGSTIGVALIVHEPAQIGAGGPSGYLAAEHRAHRELCLVDGAGHPPSRCPVQHGGQQGVGGEGLVDCQRVGVQVEQPAAAGDRGGQIPQVVQGELAGHIVGPGG